MRIRAVLILGLLCISFADAFCEERQSAPNCYPEQRDDCEQGHFIYYECCHGDCCLRLQPLPSYGVLLVQALMLIACCGCMTWCCCCRGRDHKNIYSAVP